MKLEKILSVTSKSIERRDELIDIIGQWNTGINVQINNPYTHSIGPFQKIMK